VASGGIFHYETIEPFRFFGLTGKFWHVHIDTLIATWVAMGIIFALVLLSRRFIKNETSLISVSLQQFVQFFVTLCKDSFQHFEYNYFAFVATIFLFTFMLCFVGVIPFVEEATRDLNTTVALACCSFFYIQFHKIKTHGIGGFLKEFIEPFFVMAPIHIVGELSKIASMSFRLFGNILGGAVILSMTLQLFESFSIYFLPALAIVFAGYLITKRQRVSEALPLVSKIFSFAFSLFLLLAWMQLFLGVFEGMIQAFVLTMLTTTYLGIGTFHEEHEKNSHIPSEGKTEGVAS
jgi:F-type H+-transporting ATPase subunit a